MSLRSQLAISVGKASRWFLTNFTKGGSSLPGKLALNLDPQILATLSQNYQVVVITGTNGKTLTTALTVEALKEAYPYVLTNPSGSNMRQGIVSTFLNAPKMHQGEKGIAVLEVDEGSLKHVVEALAPDYFVFTNVFRDQLDRFGEIHTIYQLMTDAARKVPTAKIIANGDLPMFHSVDLPNEEVYFGFNHEEASEVVPHYNTDGLLCPKCDHVLAYHLLTYANLGHFYCPECGFERPALSYQVDEIQEEALTHSDFTIDGHPFHLPVAGKYNLYNALAAYSVAKELGLNVEQIRSGFEKAQRVFGRQESFEINGKKVLLNLVKNPVGLDQVLSLIGLDSEPFTLVAILNNQYADGTDVSWIWDGNFEQIKNFPVKAAITAGSKAEEMTKRLTVAGLPAEQIKQVDDLSDVIETIKQSETEHVHILATYTAMLQLREALTKSGYLKAIKEG
ncbi:Mur ligase family protein [Facklamia sp. DSM 111018]|uniref:Lipid II isoglutaminyl synthase (glutamine-hydrolyzing) subunit MurT n=1 Tax=Facklamia lactis TaxID=2749967 RepID=A0ABS0LNF4_9LACT|nr:Mur ligase family protein [Facklamia lactis]MBG9979622.1 Mur ligase family protein [Facklamia lactis]MBG9985698.1 Mur ligase family protein [Facklamia lactis]